ncbi:hypothetical protein [Mycobacterium aquaticum]|uniref:Uncharacterized protein n=1 Tax=Mycobacterium aquaticum TaxID=1927124 RepID=A0A1X0A4Z6_9MYCO|nr:hypothetical protein [Mycobacterium aquaticum]ORA24935.1 hypothetical protein BST13_33750 [Mycobacterium aquaticum]
MRSGKYKLGRLTLGQLADMIDRCRDLGYGPNARVDVVFEITDYSAPDDSRGNQPAGSSRNGEQER